MSLKKVYTDVEVMLSLRLFLDALDSGDSVNVARMKAGITSYETNLAKKVKERPEYLLAVNAYMIRIGKPIKYVMIKNKMKPFKG